MAQMAPIESSEQDALRIPDIRPVASPCQRTSALVMRPYAPIPLRRAVLDGSTKVDNASAVSIPPHDDFASCSDATYDER